MNVRGAQLVQSNGNPVFPGTRVTGPFLAGNILRTGGNNLAAAGSEASDCLANVGYAKMVQAARITQAANGTNPPGVHVSRELIIPAQSLILNITSIVLVAFTGAAATFGIGNTVNPIAFTPAGGMTAPASLSINAAGAAQLPNWLNCGDIDEQFVFTSTNTGNGVMLVVIEYVQGISAPVL